MPRAKEILEHTKICCRCGIEKLKEEFNKSSSHRDGLASDCKGCNRIKMRLWNKNNVERRKEIYNNSRRANVSTRRSTVLKYAYGITLDHFNGMYKDRDGKCDICGNRLPDCGTKGLYVDHCHTLGHVRGLLCRKCNHAVGYLNDDIVLFQKAITYLDNDIANAVLCTQQGPM